jgi:hypothetical protein
MNEFEENSILGFGEVIDRIISTPSGTAPVIRKGRDGPAKLRYSWIKVYEETRKRYGRPLTLLAAERLRDEVGEGDYVFIITNSIEMDGPPGAAAIARALILGLKAIPVILVNFVEGSKYEKAVTQACIGAEIIPVLNKGDLSGSIWTPYTVLVQNWPEMSVKEAVEESKKIIDEFQPKALITVEATSCNIKGIRHGALGSPNNRGDSGERIVRWNELLKTAKKNGILTISTGDNGNECGFQTIEDILRKHHEFCADCGCPCGGGIISAAGAEIVIPAASSNWACYGIEACLAKILEKPEIMHNEKTHVRILLNCANAGIPDGASAMCTPTTDGASHESCVYLVGQLRQTLLMSSVELVRESR